MPSAESGDSGSIPCSSVWEEGISGVRLFQGVNRSGCKKSGTSSIDTHQNFTPEKKGCQ